MLPPSPLLLLPLLALLPSASAQLARPTVTAAPVKRQLSVPALPDDFSVPDQCTDTCSGTLATYSSCRSNTLSCLDFCNSAALNAFYTCANCVFENTPPSESTYNQISSAIGTLTSTCSSFGQSLSATTSLIPFASVTAIAASLSSVSAVSTQSTATATAPAEVNTAALSASSVASRASASVASASRASIAAAASASASVVATTRTFSTDSVAYDSVPLGLTVSDFAFTYFNLNNSAVYDIALNVTGMINPIIIISLNVYGMSALNRTIDVCGAVPGANICPLPRQVIRLTQPLALPDSLRNDIPAIAYSVPNLQAFATVRIVDTQTGVQHLSLTAQLTNGHTTRQVGVLIATAVFALVAILLSWFHTGWYICRSELNLGGGEEIVASNSINAAQWRCVDIAYLFQAIASTGLLTVDYPSVYIAFVLNFKWALGVWYSKSIQDAINTARRITGARLTSTAYPQTQNIDRLVTSKRSLSTALLVERSSFELPLVDMRKSFIPSIKAYVKRAILSPRLVVPSPADSAVINSIQNGLPVYANALNIPTANLFFTVLFTWLILVAIFLFLHLLLFAFVVTSTRRGDKEVWKREKGTVEGHGWRWRLRRNFGLFFVSNALRLHLVVFFPVTIFAMYQWTLNDAWLPILCSALLFAITVGTLLVAEGCLILASRTSHAEQNPHVRRQSVLSTRRPSFEDGYSQDTLAGNGEPGSVVGPRGIHEKGMWTPFAPYRPLASALYQQYRRPLYTFWLFPILFAVFAKACFIAFAQGHGNVQVIALTIIEGCTVLFYIVFRPESTKKGDWFGVILGLLRLIGTGLLLVFTTFFQPGGIVQTIIALVIVAVFGLAVVLLFVDLLFNLFRFIRRH